MKFLICIILILVSVSSNATTSLNELNLKQKEDYFERYNIQSENFFKNKSFVYYQFFKADQKVICYKLNIDSNLHFIFKHKDMEMKGKFIYQKGKITLDGTAVLVGGTKNNNPIFLEIDPEYDVFTAGEKSPYYYNGNRHLSINLKSQDSNSYNFLVYNCSKEPSCKKNCE